MNGESNLLLHTQCSHIAVNWRCGELNLATQGRGSVSSGQVLDWSRQSLTPILALDQVRLIVETAIHAAGGIRAMLGHAIERAEELSQTSEPARIATIASEVDALLNQVDAMVQQAALGNINLLGQREGSWKLPYVLTEVRDEQAYHSFITTGMSINAVRETVDDHEPVLLGLYALTTHECESVCWIPSPAFWLTLQAEDGAAQELEREMHRFVGQVRHMQDALKALESQLELYMEQVGEVVTDLDLENA